MNPNKHAADAAASIMRECRKYGICLMPADQSPLNVPASFTGLSGTKIVFRIVDARERQIIAAAMLLSPKEYEQMARLKPGQAYLFAEGFHKPRLIQTVKFHERLDISKPIAYDDLKSHIIDEPWYIDVRERIESARLLQLKDRLVNFENKRILISRHWQELKESVKHGAMDRAEASGKARLHHEELQYQFKAFHFGMYGRLIGESRATDSPELDTLRSKLQQHFVTITEPHTNMLLNEMLAFAKGHGRNQSCRET